MSIRLFNPSGGFIDLNAGGDGTAANVFTLPAETGTLLTSATAVTSIPGYGNLTEADQWRLNANITNTTSRTVFTTNWERADTYGAGYVGTGMSESSGIFTFPSTGTWLIQVCGVISVNGSQRFNAISIEVTTDNSTFDIASNGTQFTSQVDANFTIGNAYTFYIFNVTDTTNCKVRISQVCSGTAGNWGGSTVENNTSVNFIRLGAST
jgi:hypothetical protein